MQLCANYLSESEGDGGAEGGGGFSASKRPHLLTCMALCLPAVRLVGGAAVWPAPVVLAAAV